VTRRSDIDRMAVRDSSRVAPPERPLMCTRSPFVRTLLHRMAPNTTNAAVRRLIHSC